MVLPPEATVPVDVTPTSRLCACQRKPLDENPVTVRSKACAPGVARVAMAAAASQESDCLSMAIG